MPMMHSYANYFKKDKKLRQYKKKRIYAIKNESHLPYTYILHIIIVYNKHLFLHSTNDHKKTIKSYDEYSLFCLIEFE